MPKGSIARPRVPMTLRFTVVAQNDFPMTRKVSKVRFIALKDFENMSGYSMSQIGLKSTKPHPESSFWNLPM